MKRSEENLLEWYILMRRRRDTLYDTQDTRKAVASRLRQMPQDSEIAVGPLLKVEEDFTEMLQDMLDQEPIYTEFLSHVKGMGPRLSASLISRIMIKFIQVPPKELKKYSEIQQKYALKSRDADTKKAVILVPTIRENEHGKGIGAFPTVSKLWKYFGLHTVPEDPEDLNSLRIAAQRRRGGKVDWNPKMKTLQWKIRQQFIKQGDLYQEIYKKEKARLSIKLLPAREKCPRYKKCKANLKRYKEPKCEHHITNMASRISVKTFIQHVWEMWRRLEGLPVREPYAVEKLGHTKIPPEEGMTKKNKTKRGKDIE